MKNVLRLTLLSMLMVFASCQKEDVNIEDTNLSTTDAIRFVKPSEAKAGTALVNGMLEFPDQATFLSTIDNLETQAEAYDDAFVAKWDHLNDDDLEAKEIAIGHDVHQPYIDFENQFPGFISLRKDIRDTQADLIKNQTLNDSNEPDNHYVFDDGVRTVLNENAQVKIGASLFQMTRFGYVEITDGNYSTLATVANTDASQLNLQNVIIEGGYYGSSSANNPNTSSTTCRTDYDEKNYATVSNNRRIKATQKLKGYSSLWGTKIKAKTQYQKKRWWGGWTSKRTKMTSTITGESVDNDCTNANNENRSKTKRSRKVKTIISGPSVYVYKTEKQELKTIHKRYSTTYVDDYFYE
ncbi:hypothetical protein HNV10_01750 [Winogradskyella litoriviva]|uniref:DUF4848 domain-containing protein n=1 Tax=Winogradskyella litoriviva TaxID=1220182 RepID=A0ABX2E0C0_9FLAO|nr:hypothetical protein [Winogradskyella litoriviva]NRD21946.1 hypothetical protein [Winogradskyella litoriviva]